MDLQTQRLMMAAAGAAGGKTYVDDIFSTFLYEGNSASQNITNGINLAGEGGMVWAKRRSGSQNHILADTVRGITKYLNPNDTAAEVTDMERFMSVSSTGFAVGDEVDTNGSSSTYASWTFRKAPGFFDVVTYTGNGSNRTIAHSLGSIPGMIMVKRLDTGDSWFTYHKSLGGTKRIYLNATNAAVTNSSAWNDTDPTSSVFSVGTDSGVNASGGTYVAYVFAGGESTAATARSVDFDSSVGNYISQPSTSDLYGIQDQAFTVEYWMKADAFSSSQNGGAAVLGASNPTTNTEVWSFGTRSTGEVIFYYYNGSVQIETTGITLTKGVWNHLALVHDGSNGFKIFVNGILVKSGTISGSITQTAPFSIGRVSNGKFDGKISNVRVVHSAVYTSSFKPPTEPLTNITNTKLLCCNNSSVTGSTVTPGTITATSSPTASTDSPFYDSSCAVFGENEDQDVIKCGSYVGNGSATGPEINLGWEPQFIIVKQSSDSGNNWRLWDSMRGIATGGIDKTLYPSGASAESGSSNRLDLTSTGFKLTRNDSAYNGDGETYIYIAIRRPDGYVGKPPELGTDVFAMDTGNGSSTIPDFDSGFPVDFAMAKTPASADSTIIGWINNTRLTQGTFLYANRTNTESDWAAAQTFDSNTGVWSWNGYTSSFQAWMWKRHAGFDVVAYEGDDAAGHQVPHSLSKTPEMIWVKTRDYSGRNWVVYHKGLNGGTNPQNWYMNLDRSNNTQEESVNSWNNTAPTSTYMTLGIGSFVNKDDYNYIAMLFASVDGISKVGYYAGTTSNLTITTGFQPRFVIIRNITTPDAWYVLDTTRGWGSGDDEYLKLDSNAAQASHDFGAPTSTGFTLGFNNGAYNNNGDNFIYYAHA